MLWLKSKIYAIGVVIFGGLLVALKFLIARNRTLKKRADSATSQLNFERELDTIDTEIEQDFSHRADLAKEKLDEGAIPDHLRNPRI